MSPRDELKTAAARTVGRLTANLLTAAPHIINALRAFASGSLLRFEARTICLRPAGPPWALAVLLGVWAAVLA